MHACWVRLDAHQDLCTSVEVGHPALARSSKDWQAGLAPVQLHQKASPTHKLDVCRSKRHQEKLAELRDMLEAEEEPLGGSADPGAAQTDATAQADSGSGSDLADARSAPQSKEDEAGVPALGRSRKQQRKKEKKRQKQRARLSNAGRAASSDGSVSDTHDGAEAAQPASAATDQHNGFSTNGAADADSANVSSGSESAAADDIDEDDMLAAMMASHNLRRDLPGAAVAADADTSDMASSAENASSSDKDAVNGAAAGVDTASEQDSQRDASRQAGADVPAAEAAAKEESKKRRANKGGGKKKAAAAQEASVTPELACSVCEAQFSSRTKLFAHIKSSGHAWLKA